LHEHNKNQKDANNDVKEGQDNDHNFLGCALPRLRSQPLTCT